jgi:solute carrier family 39 (zinc transporter), member 1/2/3
VNHLQKFDGTLASFTETFEALGLGTRLATLPLRRRRWLIWAGAIAYACVTPLGLGIGIGLRHSYNPVGPVASAVSGILDATSAGILLYTGWS